MLSTIFAGAVRHRRLVLGVAVVVAAGCLGVQSLSAPAGVLRHAMPLPLFVLALVSVVLAALARMRARPAAFAVDPGSPAFRTPPHAARAYLAAALTFVSGGQVANRLVFISAAEHDPELDSPTWHLLTGAFTGSTGLLVAVSAVYVIAVWRGNIGVQLRPDGLVDHGLLGTLTVPWAALAAGYPPWTPPAATSVVLTYARPELVRRRGLAFSRRRLGTDNVNALFLVYAIRHYLAYPEHRAAIGTQAEHDCLLRELTAPNAWGG